MFYFSKSKLLALRQCPKRLWLELHRPDLRENSDATHVEFHTGNLVGDIARRIFDSTGQGVLIDVQNEGFNRAFARTLELLESAQPIFEAGFAAKGVMAFADVLLPVHAQGQLTWRMLEVKSSTTVKPYHLDDLAIQAFTALAAGAPLTRISLAHIDSSWTYPGNGDYNGLLKEVDLTAETFSRTEEVKAWIALAQCIEAMPTEPVVEVGSQCDIPFACGFYDYCNRNAHKATHPVDWLPYFGSKARALAAQGITELEDVPSDMLNTRQQRVKTHTLENTVYFDAEGAAEDLAPYPLPAYFLDFETIQFAVPIWPGTRPYQQQSFQFSLHALSEIGQLTHSEFLDLSGTDPSEPFAKALIAACGEHGPVYAYNAGFEMARMNELALRHPQFSAALQAINARVVDLLPIARERYYHPSQQGSWSIKKVLPALVPELRYDALDGVQDGGMAMDAFVEAIDPGTPIWRKNQIEQQLLDYCKLDTYALVRLWQIFAGHTDWRL